MIISITLGTKSLAGVDTIIMLGVAIIMLGVASFSAWMRHYSIKL